MENVNHIEHILKDLENRASTFIDVLYLSDCYFQLTNEDEHLRLLGKAGHIFAENDRKGINTAEDYYRMSSTFPLHLMRDKQRRDSIEPLYKKMVALAPDNPQYLIAYSDYLNYQDDTQRSIEVMEKVDSLYMDDSISMFSKSLPHYEIKLNLMKKYFNTGDYEKVITYYMEADSLMPPSVAYDEDSTSAILLAYAYTGNGEMVESLLATARFRNASEKVVAFVTDYLAKRKQNK